MSGTGERDAAITKLVAGGWTCAAVGRRFGISRQRVDQIVRPAKQRARRDLTAAVARGEIMRPAECERCNERGDVEAHHEDYDKPLDVEWLCVPCHRANHRGGGRPRPKRRVVVPCPTCGNEVRRPPSDHVRFCSPECAHEARKIDDTELLADLRRLAQEFGRTPTQQEINTHGRFPHIAYYRHFGSLREAAKRAGLNAYGPGAPSHRDNRGEAA